MDKKRSETVSNRTYEDDNSVTAGDLLEMSSLKSKIESLDRKFTNKFIKVKQ